MRWLAILCLVAACAPTASDTCSTEDRCGDSFDNDCDGSIDEGCECVPGTIQPCGDGSCAGEQLCEAGAWSACYGGAPAPEVCDDADNDCDGVADNGDNACGGVCPLDGIVGDTCDGVDGDLCREGTWSCASANHLSCSDTTGTRVELCGDGADENCDGRADEYCEMRLLQWADHGGSTVPGARARALDVAVAIDGSIYVAGSHDRAVAFGGGAVTWDAGTSTDGSVVKYSATGQLIWHRAIAGSAAATAIAIAGDGTIVVGGGFRATADFAPGVSRTASGGDDAFVARYTPGGDLVAATSFGGTADEAIADLAIGPAGEIALAGTSNRAPLVARFAADLALSWLAPIEFAAPASGDLEATAIAFDASGAVIAGGGVRCFQQCQAPHLVVGRGSPGEISIEVSASFRAGFLARLSSTGSALAAVAVPRVGGIAIEGSELYATGEFSGIEPLAVDTPAQTTLVAKGQADIWLARYTTTLDLAWATRFGSATSCGGFGVASDDAGLGIALDAAGPLVVGTHQLALELAPDLSLAGDGWGNVFWAGFERDGQLAWGHNGKIGETPCSGGGSARAIAATPDGVVVVGELTGHLILPDTTLTGTNDFFVAAFAR